MKRLILFYSFISLASLQATIIPLSQTIPQGASNSDYELLMNYIKSSKKPILVKFYADWCAPCRRLAPIVKEVDTIFGEQIIIINVNIDSHRQLSNQLAIRYLPTIVYFKSGQEVQRTNSTTKSTLEKIINNLLI